MFARLKEFEDTRTYQDDCYLWIQTPSSDNLYEICSIHHAGTRSDTYMLLFLDYETYDRWLREMCAMSNPATKAQVSPDDRIVTLSTCTADADYRMVVQGKLVYRRGT